MTHRGLRLPPLSGPPGGGATPAGPSAVPAAAIAASPAANVAVATATILAGATKPGSCAGATNRGAVATPVPWLLASDRV